MEKEDNTAIEQLLDWVFPTMGLVYPGDLEAEVLMELCGQLSDHGINLHPIECQDSYGHQIARRCVAYRRDVLKIGDGSREACDAEYQKWCAENHDDLFKE